MSEAVIEDGLVIRLAGRGDGVTADSRHVPLTAPGDVVDPFGVITRGPHHVDPPCKHFPRCGGCELQHVDNASYADFVSDRITGALKAQGVDVPEMLPAHLSPSHTRRRATMRAERIGKRIVLGFNEGSSHRIIDLAQCHILHPDLFALVAPLRKFLLELMRDKRAATLQMSLTDQGVDLLLEKVSVEGLAAVEALTEFAQTHRLARLSIDDGDGPQARWEPAGVTVTLGGIAVGMPVAGFLQATADGEAALLAAVSQAVNGAATIADLFAGLGTFALPLSANAKVYAAEGARDPALALKLAAARSGRQMVVEHRDLYRRPLDAKELARFDAVVLDPPRAGAKEQMVDLARSDVARVVYVSCNPQTFARDAKTLIDGGYRLERIMPVGQFRWSTHVELVGTFAR